MILAGIIFLSGIILEIIFYKMDSDGSLLTGMAGASLFIAFLFPVLGSLDSDAYIYKEKIVLQEPIYSLETVPSVRGGFVLGIGSLDAEPKYYFYTKDEHEGLRLKSVYSSDCTIIETDKIQPSIKVIQKVPAFKDTFYKIMFWPNLRLPKYHYILYLPPGTVKKVYSGNVGSI
ncbi:hypothetical protein O163_10140 [Caldanaerobacter subterraneus subsp. yonseiensis KB-1]|uniref:Uncharacterized protein n=1 Tax=Caldanaerobacter subterraneus subsp. yonseiensis KB-1 TaxID=1388761 RepID=U5CNE9_CALSX|nr:hypothetical protein [Caldanaerobacter subterraneus]ERM91523.1 hypothetical protein O163_10140 [Caldanaerobacter subterraneus subsp. yonseiensis KB-1]